MFIVLSSDRVNRSLGNQKCMTQLTLLNLTS